MSQAERPKFKSTIIDAEWTRAPSGVPSSHPSSTQPVMQAVAQAVAQSESQPASPESEPPRRSEPRLAVWSRSVPGEAVVARGPFIMNTEEEIARAFADLREGGFQRL